MDGKILNSKGARVGVVARNEIFGLKGQKLYDLKGSNIYKLNGDLGPVGIQDSHRGLVVIQASNGPIRFD